MEILVHTAPELTFTLPTPTATIVSVELDGAVLPWDVDDRRVTASLPYVSNEGVYKVTWNFEISGESHSRDIYYEAVTPYLSFEEVKSVVPTIDEEDYLELEASIRHIINSFTGQSFGRFEGAEEVFVPEGRTIPLPRRLISVNSPSGSIVVGGQWFVTRGLFSRFLGHDPITSGGVIRDPHSIRVPSKYIRHNIDGVWGWEYIPGAVVSAAKLLANDYACGENLYRDKYMASMTAADWRIQFHPLAFHSGTGNARADDLLESFVIRHKMLVI